MKSYLMESPLEAARLEHKTDFAQTRRQLLLAGLRPGMRALEAGTGSGAVARVMAELVGPSGSVVGVDPSGERLSYARVLAGQAGLHNLSFKQGDIVDGSFAEASFDFVFCRFVFEYLPDPDRALENLVRATRRGGKVVVADLDGNASFHDGMPAALERDLERVIGALQGRFDPFAGRKLYRRFRAQALDDVVVHLGPHHLYAGAADARQLENWRIKLEVIRPAVEAAVGGPERYEAFCHAFLEFLADPDTFTYSVLLMVEGRRR